MVELMLQKSSSVWEKNVFSFTRFLQYPQTDLYQFFALIKCYIKEELSLIKEWKKLRHKIFFCANSYLGFFVVVPEDVIFFRNSPI